jgi:peptidoglycan/xylan/chitin deacetylase (PgdA/CDA1 family)
MTALRKLAGALRRRLLTGFYRRPVDLNGLGPIVTFSFDDFPRTALTSGAEILEKYGARGTYYVAMSLMGVKNNLGEQFYADDMKELVARGHEIGSHTYNHLSARNVSLKRFEQDVILGEHSIAQAIEAGPKGNFAYPYGEATIVTKKHIGPAMLCCRGTCPGINGPEVDLNLLRANSLYGGMERAEQAISLLEENRLKKGWLIFYSHDVRETPSPFGCTPELLDTVCSTAVAKQMRFMPVSQVMKELGLAKDCYSSRTAPSASAACLGSDLRSGRA